MTRYAAFLRGINVTGRRVKGAELCAPLEGIGLREVATFRASGNVFFEADEAAIGAALEAALGYEVLAQRGSGPGHRPGSPGLRRS